MYRDLAHPSPHSSQRVPKPRVPVPQPPLLHAEPPIALPPLPLPILPPQIPHLRHCQHKATHHRAQTNAMPQDIMRRILLQVHKRANKRTAIRNRDDNAHPRGSYIVRREVIARPPHDHGTALEDADGNEERAGVAGRVVGRGEEQDVPDEADEGACCDEGAARFEAVGEVSAGKHGNEGGYVGGNGEELRGSRVVAHALHDTGEEEREAVEGDLLAVSLRGWLGKVALTSKKNQMKPLK